LFSRVRFNALGFLLSSPNILFFSGLHVEVNISHSYYNINTVYIHVPKEKMTKLEPSGKKDTFVGYNETSKAYQIYVLGKKYIEVSRDVTFHEEDFFRRSRELPCDT
jgi:hypothetical protein